MVLRELVSECRAEVGCFAEESLEVVKLGLASPNIEIKARAASLVSRSNAHLHRRWRWWLMRDLVFQFHGVVTFASGPTLSLADKAGQLYLDNIDTLANLAQSKDTR